MLFMNLIENDLSCFESEASTLLLRKDLSHTHEIIFLKGFSHINDF